MQDYTCQHKSQYAKKEAALKALLMITVQIRKQSGDGKQGILHVYRCKTCGYWHVGHTTKTARVKDTIAGAKR